MLEAQLQHSYDSSAVIYPKHSCNQVAVFLHSPCRYWNLVNVQTGSKHCKKKMGMLLPCYILSGIIVNQSLAHPFMLPASAAARCKVSVG